MKQDETFEIRIFSNPINFFHFYLIYCYTHGISSPENISLQPRHISPLKKAFEKRNRVGLFLRFCGTLF